MQKTTIRCGSNIAFIKYWGVADAELNLPLNSSVSMTLADAHTTTTVEWVDDGSLSYDKVIVNDMPLPAQAADRIVRHLDRIRTTASVDFHARVASRNNFPIASGIASSASGFAALTVAACAALGLELSATELSALARRGSGSASRSLFGGFVQWDKGHDHVTSVARQIYPAEHWDLVDVVAVVSSLPKQVSSEGGHKIAQTSPLNDARVNAAEKLLPEIVEAIRRHDMAKLGESIELDAVAMHSVMMTCTPSLYYWLPGTMEIVLAVQQWRRHDGLKAYFTIDAGPNVHVICEPDDVREVQSRLQALDSVEKIITSGAGPGPQVLQDHLF